MRPFSWTISVLLLLLFVLPLPLPGQTAALRDIRQIGTTRDYGVNGEMTNPTLCPSLPNILSFETVEAGRKRHLYWVNMETHVPYRIVPRTFDEDLIAESDREISWAPRLIREKQWFVFVSSGTEGNDDIYLGNTRDSIYIRLTSNPTADHHPRWAPNGESIVYVSARTGAGDLHLIDGVLNLIREFDLWRQAPDLSPLFRREAGPVVIPLRFEERLHHRLTQNPDVDTYPAWSPDSRLVAFTSYVTTDDERTSEICILDPLDPGAGILNVSRSKDRDEFQPSWSKDGESIAFYFSPPRKDQSENTSRRVSVGMAAIGPLGRCALSTPRQPSLSVLAVDVRQSDYYGPVWAGPSGAIIVIREIGRSTPISLVSFREGETAKTIKDLEVPRREEFIQNRQIDGLFTPGQSTIAFMSYEGQDYTLHTAHCTGDPFGKPTPEQFLIPRRNPTFADRFRIELECRGSFLNSSFAVGIPGLQISMEQKDVCLLGRSFLTRVNLGFGSLIVADDSNVSNAVPLLEISASFGPKFAVNKVRFASYLLIGLGALISFDGGIHPSSAQERLGLITGAGFTIESDTVGESVTIGLTHRRFNPPAFDATGNSSFWTLHLGVAYNVGALLNSSGGPE